MNFIIELTLLGIACFCGIIIIIKLATYKTEEQKQKHYT